jgi:hypothetical protein
MTTLKTGTGHANRSDKDRPNVESSYTKWSLGKDYMRQVLPLQYNAQRLSMNLGPLGTSGGTLPLRQACPNRSDKKAMKNI